MRLYLEVSRDRYSLPLIVTESVIELSRLSGATVNNIYSTISHANKKGYVNPRFIIVEVEEVSDE